jgi:hypothetical protein
MAAATAAPPPNVAAAATVGGTSAVSMRRLGYKSKKQIRIYRLYEKSVFQLQ